MLSKYLMLAILGLALTLGGTGLLLRKQIKKNGEQEQILKQRMDTIVAMETQARKDAALLQRRAAAEREARKQAQASRKALEDSLFKNQEWASTPVPKEVQDALAP